MISARRILGVRVDDITEGETLTLCRRFIAEGGAHQIVTVNPEFVMLARRNLPFARTLERSALAVPDGAGLRLACWLAGQPIRGLVRGIELVERLAAMAADDGWRLFLLGAAEGVAEAAARVLQQRHPSLQVAGCYAGNAGPAGDAAALARIAAAGRVDLLLVAYGAPAQDLWIARNAPHLSVPLAIGVGGAFDYISGVVPRAPRLVIDAGFEWLYRLIRQPWRWKRQTALVRYLLLVLVSLAVRRPAVSTIMRSLSSEPED